MLSEFFEYIAQQVVGYFTSNYSTLRPGERFCLRLDTEEMVQGVHSALEAYTQHNAIQGIYSYKSVYSTFTIRVSQNTEVVVASKINGMTDDFLATLRNADLTAAHHPILMITNSPIDSIISGTADLSARGMPFHPDTLQKQIQYSLDIQHFAIHDQVLLRNELQQKAGDRFTDKTSLYEYCDILTVLKRGYVKDSDYPRFALFRDPDISSVHNEKEAERRIEYNRTHFERISQAMRHGNIAEQLEKYYDRELIRRLEKCKNRDENWQELLTYKEVQISEAKLAARLESPLDIQDSSIIAFSDSPLEYTYPLDEKLFIKSEGDTKVKRRSKHILVYNPDRQPVVSIQVESNKTLQKSWISKENGASVSVSGKKLKINISSSGCSFAHVAIKEPNSAVHFHFRICVLDIAPTYLETIQTRYLLHTPSALRNAHIRVMGVQRELLINPSIEEPVTVLLQPNQQYTCTLNQSLCLSLDENSIDADQGYSEITVCCGAVKVPMQIVDNRDRPIPIGGKQLFKQKHELQRSFEYIGSRIVLGTQEYFVTDRDLKHNLELESLLVNNGWLAIREDLDDIIEQPLEIPVMVRDAYVALVNELRCSRMLPSLTFYSGEILELAQKYVDTVVNTLSEIRPGAALTPAQSNLLLIGSVVDQRNDTVIKLSPLHPLNVLYQINLLHEAAVGAVRDQLVDRLSTLFLLPFIRDPQRKMYQAIEQKHSPEWNMYAQLTNKRYQGSRSFVKKLVADKIDQYEKHFPFLFDDLGNHTFIINLINMGDCREVMQGLLQYYCRRLTNLLPGEDLTHFVVNIYDAAGSYNEFSLLNDQRKLRTFVKSVVTDSSIDINDLVQLMPRNIHCYFRDPQDATYEYAHLAFYEMPMAEENGDGRMQEITTGISLNGILSGTPSVLDSEWYKTGFGTKYAPECNIVTLASLYNALANVAYTGSSYEPNTCTFAELKSGQEGILGKIYQASNWVVFVEPKVDLSFFQSCHNGTGELMIIHYSDQYTSASGYDDITVTSKSDHYSDIIREQLTKKGVSATNDNIRDIINLFNAVNGSWMLKLISTKKLAGALDSNFSREKMSILAAIKLCMAYYAHPDILWIPISLEEMLRVSGGAGLSQKEGLLSAKNLGFENGPASDDILMVGIEGSDDDLKVYLHPVEVKIGQNSSATINKACIQIAKTHKGLLDALWPSHIEKRNTLECKLSRNFLMQLVLVCCEKMRLYKIYPDIPWENVLIKWRRSLLNENYTISDRVDQHIGKGSIISFKTDALIDRGTINDDQIAILEFPEWCGSEYLVRSAADIEKTLRKDRYALPPALSNIYFTPAAASVDPTDKPDPNEEPVETLSDDVIQISSAEDEEQPITPTTEDSDTPAFPPVDAPTPSSMQILIGTDITTGKELYWRPNDTNQVFHTNTGIIGTMGTGKTQFTKSLVAQLYREQSHNYDGSTPLGILIFDYKGDYNESKSDFVSVTNAKVLKPYHLPFNPLALIRTRVFKPLLPIHTANAFKATLSKVYDLGPKQENTLFSCIIAAYESCGIFANQQNTWDRMPPTFNMVYQQYIENESIKKNDSLAAAMEKLQQFEIFEAVPAETQSLFDLLDGVVVIDLSGYDTDIQSLIVAITLDLFYVQMQATGSSQSNQQFRQLTKLILVDEADNFMSEGFPSLKKILKEGREFGVGTILSTQFLKHFGTGDDDYAKYILTWIVHNVADLKPSDVEFVFKTEPKSIATQDLFSAIKALTKHHSIVKLGNAQPQFVVDRAFWQLYNDLQQE